jgi:hypothetical protein
MPPSGERRSNLRRLLEENRPYWDNDVVLPYARSSIAQALLCGSEVLGAQVYASILGERRIVPNSCKSRACISCGYWQTMRWQREVASQLPDILYSGLILTMPRPFWGLLRKNRNLLRAIPELAAGVLTDWVRERFEAVIPVVAVMHTFNAKLEFNVHVHLVVGQTGLHLGGDGIVHHIYFPKGVIHDRWRRGLLDFFELAVSTGNLQSTRNERALLALIARYGTRYWKVIISENRGIRQILGYVARYVRRPPMADYRIQGWDKDNVRFLWRDKKNRGAVREEIIPIHMFISRFIDQIPDKGVHSVRYFGLLTPHARQSRYEAFLRLLPTPRPQPVRRLRWASSIWRTFGRDPSFDSAGNRMSRIGHLLPANRNSSADS